MSSAALLNLLRVSRYAATRQTLIGVRSSPEATVQVGHWFVWGFFCHNIYELKPHTDAS